VVREVVGRPPAAERRSVMQRKTPLSQRITVQFPPDRDNDFYFRVFCWADDTLYPAIDMKGLGVIHDLDRVRETVRIDVHKRQHLGEVLGLLKTTLPQHFPGGEGRIVRGDAAAG
jgi:hypothetical protein